MVSLSRSVFGGLLALTIGVAPAWADVVYTDTTFNLANYSASPAFSSDPSASIAYGSAANTLTFTATFTLANATSYDVTQALANTTFTYDPLTQGAITSIDASVLKDLSITFTAPPGSPFGNTFHPTILQDGTYYLAAIPGPSLTSGPSSTGYNLLAQAGLTAADFVSFDFTTGTSGTAHPNFDGDPMLLGLAQNSGLQGFAGQVIAQYQDLRFDIHTVPEPSPVLLCGQAASILLGYGWLRRRATKAA